MGAHYDRFTQCIRQTIKEVVPSRKKIKFNGRTIAEKTRALYNERIREFNSGRKITSKDRDACNRVLAQAGRDDYADWADKITRADEVGDTKIIYKGVKALAGISASYSNKQPAKTLEGKTIDSAEELAEV